MVLDLREAYKEAQHQYGCHADQVSGCWSISGKTFCEKYGLDYDHASEKQMERNSIDLTDEQYEVLSHIMRYVKLTQEQIDQVNEKVADDFYEEEEGAAFWDDIMEQIKAKMPEKEEDEC